MNKVNHTAFYANMFKAWAKQAGRQPTAAELETAHCFGRPGKQSLALAMALRDTGVSGSQIVLACGAPQLNHMRDVIRGGLFKREAAAFSSEGHAVYKLVITAKGEAAKAKALKAADTDGADTEAKPAKVKAKADKPVKPAKAAGKAKPAKVRVIGPKGAKGPVVAANTERQAPAAEQPTSEPAAGTEAQQPEMTEA